MLRTIADETRQRSSGAKRSSQQGARSGNVLVLCLRWRNGEDGSEKTGWRSFRWQKWRSSNDFIFELLARGAALVRHRMADREHPFKRVLLWLGEFAEGLTGPEERLGSLFSVVIRQPINVGLSTKHYIPSDSRRTKSYTRPRGPGRGDAAGQQPDEEFFQ